jgi:predicted TIM-barrel fold metal-dependent hydrolase
VLIADSQVHIWRANTPERPWVPGTRPHRARPLGHEELLDEMDAAGVDRAVIVPPSLDGYRNDLALAAAQAHPERFAVMGKIDVNDPQAREQLAKWRRQPGMLGLRFNFKRAPETLASGDADWVWDVAEEATVPIYVGVSHESVHVIDLIAERHPGLRIIFDHMALSTGVKDEVAFRELDKLLAAAKRPNLAVKVSALPCYTDAPYPYRNLHAHVRRVYDAFGPKRMMWGSDFSRLRGSYRECVTVFTEEMEWLSAADLEWIMGRTLCEWLGWESRASIQAGVAV